ncbi:MAG TPA: sodium:proton antiporter [Balneolaceae bacterium]|nr:sodium:proton antiporter [Balneolaceae bacterium]
MESTAIVTAKHVLFTVGIVLASGSVVGFIAEKIRVPDIVLFLVAGILLGPEVGGVINISAGSALNQIILIFGASYILFDGGVTVDLKVLKDVWVSLVVLATIGVLITAFVVGFTAQYVFNIPFMVALLMGSVIAATDPATLVPVFKQVSIRDRVSHLVMSESALNDAMGAIITVTVLAIIQQGSGSFSAASSLGQLGQEAGIGILIGLISGYLAVLLTAHERYGFLREYIPLVTLIAVVGGYLGAEVENASGYMAAFVAGLVIGNKELLGFGLEPGEERELDEFIETTSLIMRMFIFILLGSQVNFHLLNAYWVGGIIVVAVFMLIARPLTIFICCLPDRHAKWSFKEMVFFCWVRETGVIPSALAGLLLGIHAPHAQLIASVTFMAVMITILLQATTTKWVGEKLGLLVELPATEAEEA